MGSYSVPWLGGLMRRRDFIKNSALVGGALLSPEGTRAFANDSTSGLQAPIQPMPLPKTIMLDLSPARWIWYPSERTLQNTFVLFRRQLDLPEKPRARQGVGGGGRPLPAGSQRPTRAVGAGPLRPTLAGSRSHGLDGASASGRQHPRRASAFLRPGRRHMADRKVWIHLLAGN